MLHSTNARNLECYFIDKGKTWKIFQVFIYELCIWCAFFPVYKAEIETHTKAQATQHGWLPSLLVYGDKGIEIVYGEEKIFCAGPIRAAKIDKKKVPL
jgi:hypothetical protein